MTLRTQRPPLEEAEIRARLTALGGHTHPDLVAHLRVLNGADARNYNVSFAGEDTGSLTFLGFLRGACNLESVASALRGRIPDGFVPIAKDGCGNAFLVAPSGKVRYWDHDIARSKPAFNSLPELVAALELDPGAVTRPDLRTLTAAEFLEMVRPRLCAEAGAADRLDLWPLLAELDEEHRLAFWTGACSEAPVETVQALLDDGVPIDAQTFGGTGRTGLMAAAQGANLPVVELLLALGADPTIRHAGGKSALTLSRDFTVTRIIADAQDAWPSGT